MSVAARIADNFRMSPTGWMTRALLPIGLAALDTAWLYPWSLMIGLWLHPGTGDPLLSVLAVFLALFIGRWATWTARRLRWPLGRTRLGLITGGLLLVVLIVLATYRGEAVSIARELAANPATIPDNLIRRPTAPFLALVLGLVLWWRGSVHGREDIDFGTIVGAFKTGIIALVIFLLVASLTSQAGEPTVQSQVSLAVLGFFFAGLTSMAIARLASIRQRSQRQHGHAPALNNQWLSALFAVVVAILLVTLVLAQILSFDLIAAIWRPIGWLLGTIIYWIVMIIAIPIGLLLELLVYLARLLFPPGTVETLPQQADLGFLRSVARGEPPADLPPEVYVIAKWVALGIFAVLALLAIARAVFWRRENQQPDEIEEERDSVWTWDMLAQAIRDWWARVRGRFARAVVTEGQSPVFPSTSTTPETPAARSIREVYRHLLRFGEQFGLTRSSGATPHEHECRLRERLAPEEDIARITETYERARYGREPLAEDAVAVARERLARIRERTIGENVP